MTISYNKRQKVYNRDNRKCCKCGATKDLTIDHIIPQSIIRINSNRNLQTLCQKCNVGKGAKVRIYTKVKECVRFTRGFKEVRKCLSEFNYQFQCTLLMLWMYGEKL